MIYVDTLIKNNTMFHCITSHVITSPPEVRSVAIGVSVCLSVGLSVRTIQKSHVQTSRNFCTCYLWLRLGPPLTIMQYVMYLWFCE